MQEETREKLPLRMRFSGGRGNRKQIIAMQKVLVALWSVAYLTFSLASPSLHTVRLQFEKIICLMECKFHT